MLDTQAGAAAGGASPGTPPTEGVAAVLVEAGTIVLLLPPGLEAPLAGKLQLASGEASWQALLWRDGQGNLAGGIGVARGRSIAFAQLTGCLVDRGGDGAGTWRVPALGQLDLSPQPIAQHLTATGGDPQLLLEFLRGALGGEPAPSGRVLDFLNGYLHAVAQQAGFVEVVARPECGGLLLQGWGFNLVAGEVAAGVLGADLQMASCILATFERDDLVAPAKGFVAYFKDVAATDSAAVRHAFLAAGGQLVRMDTALQHRLLLEGPAAAEHLAGMIPRLVADRRIIGGLKRVCRPHYPGHDTISAMPVPLRAAIDEALLAEGAGLLVTGWLLDPEARVERAFLKSTRNFYSRLDERWVRQPRPDLLEAYAADRLFAGRLRPGDRMHGFLAFVPCPRPVDKGEEFYLELLLEDGGCGFLPIVVEPAFGHRHTTRLLASIAPDAPELTHIVEDHLAPFVAAVGAAARPLTVIGRPILLGDPLAAPLVSAVVPLGQDWLAIETFLTRLAADPEFQKVEMVFVADREDAHLIGERLGRTMRFHGLSGCLLLTAEQLDLGAAFTLGAKAAKGRLLLCASTSVLPQEQRWLGRLAAECQASAAGLVCPTLLYEDGSIHYGGTDPAAEGRLAGYPASWLGAAAATDVAHGPAECFLIERALFLEQGGLAGGLLGPELRHQDLGRRLERDGRRCRWVPSVRLWSLDDQPPGPADPLRRLVRQVDKAVFRRRWAVGTALGANP